MFDNLESVTNNFSNHYGGKTILIFTRNVTVIYSVGLRSSFIVRLIFADQNNSPRGDIFAPSFCSKE